LAVPREREEMTAESARLLAQSGSRLLVVGDAGMGKSTLLARLLQQRPSSSRLLVVRGYDVEREVGFAVLSDLLTALEDAVDELPAALRDEVRSFVDPTIPVRRQVDRPLLGAAVAMALQRAAQPTALLAIDDLQWVDDASFVR
jgi:ABC-type cobalamin/Fe3+-siderophores transport system ATPase subunit